MNRNGGPVSAGFNVVTLANNHAFDCMEGGFQEVRSVLDELGLRHFGAGMNLDQATAPAIVECNGLRVAFIAAVDQRSRPYQFADAERPPMAIVGAGRSEARR
jgi:poly-gamma-glutamate synthesis protein (capsule biosynthesis protein)